MAALLIKYICLTVSDGKRRPHTEKTHHCFSKQTATTVFKKKKKKINGVE